VKILVTGGTGFLGSALVHRLVREGHRVRVLDNNWRGLSSRLSDVRDDVELIEADIRDADAVARAVRGMQCIFHLASVNGTEHFYREPQTVLDVGLRGMMNLIDAIAPKKGGCHLSSKKGDIHLFLSSTSEVYQTPPTLPTDEAVQLSIPDVLNPRYSYAGAKLASELMALHWASLHASRVVVFRPHNVYGPDMGTEHVIPQFALRMCELVKRQEQGAIGFPIQGTGRETRAFNYIDDFIDGLLCLLSRGEHRSIYHIGTDVETDIATLAHEVARLFDREIRIVPGELQAGSAPRRCPDISKLRALGYAPRVTLREGLEKTVRWYRDNLDGYRDARRVA
jgi:nucleoside-diphosphate-sugar epimerase